MKRHSILLLLALATLLGGCKALREMKALSKCQFRIGTVTEVALAGINIQKIRKFADLPVKDAAKVGAALAGGTLPLSLVVNLEVKNPNKQMAAMNRLEWVAMIDDKEMLNGIVSDRVEVEPNGGVAKLPIQVNVNLRKVLGSMGKTELLDFGMGITDQESRPTRVSMKLKPSIMVGKKAVEYPGWFTVKREFAAQ